MERQTAAGQRRRLGDPGEQRTDSSRKGHRLSASITSLIPEVLANPYPLYRRLREEDPVHWDPYLHAWVVTRYADVVTVLHRYQAADRTPDRSDWSISGWAS